MKVKVVAELESSIQVKIIFNLVMRSMATAFLRCTSHEPFQNRSFQIHMATQLAS